MTGDVQIATDSVERARPAPVEASGAEGSASASTPSFGTPPAGEAHGADIW